METYIEKKHVEENYILNKKQNETKKNFENWEKNQQNNFSRGTTQLISIDNPNSINNKNCDDENNNILKKNNKIIKGERIDKNNNENSNLIIKNLEKQTDQISINILNILKASNIPNCDILKRTNKRFAKAFLYLTEGYNMNVKNIIKKSIYKRKYKNNTLIKIKDIHVYSLCKHHLLPFEGLCDIEYNPDKYIMGLSKFSRVTDIYARRLQLQEDLTNDICNALKKYLKPLYIKVTIKAKHLCINMRGVKEHDAMTVTHASYVSKQNVSCFKENINSSKNEISKSDTHNKSLS
ncbi:GTP cyclohydrolase I, putative [Plasmodium berghei]|uniref:GTP cyclohydrolase 1 n=2 Tax=Plasmodium berghei TaxID=5821 RepID=A0A509AQS7_PLABA|nr:GTP cyclohydrolase 1, putative [Plasmodium berghei ANKA]AAT27388.1 GTP cyclohydrolase I [Plasmodium berghei]CXJ22315.1 GTP cyclohydrolase I, putative [Plasmodium berghei]SCM26654.1 GTP cyclohydrolase I, putative [Plasmodium berghei]SCN28568.1 GTP cyclohydrolase I, putative [Plasmodium berghei]SCO62757.1 GTP cyclohydrolase I, putative [Plasmodium berghei]|eukprot:XP_034424213.1 GTP cyclohydrolase 1, putative [Plasmodium berghei ANKA]